MLPWFDNYIYAKKKDIDDQKILKFNWSRRHTWPHLNKVILLDKTPKYLRLKLSTDSFQKY